MLSVRAQHEAADLRLASAVPSAALQVARAVQGCDTRCSGGLHELLFTCQADSDKSADSRLEESWERGVGKASADFCWRWMQAGEQQVAEHDRFRKQIQVDVTRCALTERCWQGFSVGHKE